MLKKNLQFQILEEIQVNSLYQLNTNETNWSRGEALGPSVKITKRW